MAIPSETDVEVALRDVIIGFVEAGKSEELTLRIVRAAAARALGLDETFFKADAKWKNQSKEFILEEVARRVPSIGSPAKEQSPTKPPTPKSQTLPKSSPSIKAASSPTKPSSSPTKAAKPGAKRKSQNARSPPPKRAKKPAISDDEGDAATNSDESLSSIIEDSPPSNKKKLAKPTTKREKASDNVQPARKDTLPKAKARPLHHKTSPAKATTASDSDSLSSVVDEPPPKKRAKPPATPARPKQASSTTSTLTPDEEEIKRLQGWLIKCGIRKLWHRELAPFATPKAKISHLKSMLSDAGMEGRYSVEKARLIREKRELQADLEAVQEGERMWGSANADGESPGRRKTVSQRRMEERMLLEGDEESD